MTEGPWFLVIHADRHWTIQTRRGGGGKPIAQSYQLSSVEDGRAIAALPELANCARALDLLQDSLRKAIAIARYEKEEKNNPYCWAELIKTLEGWMDDEGILSSYREQAQQALRKAGIKEKIDGL
jgi:hypothetical protein